MALQTWVQTLISAQGDGSQLSNSTSPTSILPAAAKFSLPANSMSIGQVYRITALGRLSNVVTTPGTLTLTAGIITAAMDAIKEGIPLSGGTARTGARDTGEPATGPIKIVLQQRQRHDLVSQMSGLGGAPTQVTTGASVMNYAPAMLSDYNKKWIETYYEFHLNGAMVIVDNNISTSGNKAKGGVFAEDAYLQVTYRGLKEKSVESDDGRFTKQTVTADYGYGVEIDPHTVEIWTDATAPAT